MCNNWFKKLGFINKKKTIFIYLFVVLLVNSSLLFCNTYVGGNLNTEVKACMDIGSTVTTLVVAKVDLKTNKILEVLHEESENFNYKVFLKESGNDTLSDSVMEKGLHLIKKLSDTAKNKYKVKKIIGVATAGLRQAKNRSDYVKKILTKTGVMVYVIDQEQEGKLVFSAIRGYVGDDVAKDCVSWDIGGGSFQIAMLKDGEIIVYNGNIATMGFKDYIIQNIQKRDIKVYNSPNPMTKQDIKTAETYASDIAKKVDKVFKEKIANPKTKVFGVGGVFVHNIYPLNKHEGICTIGELEKAVSGLVDMSDKDLGRGPFAFLKVSSPIFVLGVMKELKMNELTTVNFNAAFGALASPSYWKD